MDDTGVDGRTAEPDDGESDEREQGVCGDEQEQETERDDRASHADEETVGEAHGEEAVDESSECETEIEHTRIARRRFGREGPFLHEIGARPQGGGQLQRTVAEEHQKAGNGAADREDLAEGEGL